MLVKYSELKEGDIFYNLNSFAYSATVISQSHIHKDEPLALPTENIHRCILMKTKDSHMHIASSKICRNHQSYFASNTGAIRYMHVMADCDQVEKLDTMDLFDI